MIDMANVGVSVVFLVLRRKAGYLPLPPRFFSWRGFWAGFWLSVFVVLGGVARWFSTFKFSGLCVYFSIICTNLSGLNSSRSS